MTDGPAGGGSGPTVGLLEPVLRDYDWGSPSAIPELIGVDPPGGPVAEAWYGAHPTAPSTLVAHRSGGSTAAPVGGGPLTEVIADAPERVLGAEVASRHDGTLPYLVKLLAADRPLSIQVHPSAQQAAAGFAHEEAAGVPLEAPGRLYRDPCSKPEVIVALEPFDMLCGFREPQDALSLLAALGAPALAPLSEVLDGNDAPVLRAATRLLADQSPGERRTCIAQVASGAAAVTTGRHAPACGWLARLAGEHPDDIGVLFAVLMNHHRLDPLEACFLPARTLHAYLRGTGVEVMGNSDNVLRAGLTSKVVALDELVEVLDYDPALPPVLAGPPSSDATVVGSAPWSWPVPADEFALELVGGETTVAPDGPEVLVGIGGEARLVAPGSEPIAVGRGSVAFVGADTPRYDLDGDARVIRVHVRTGR